MGRGTDFSFEAYGSPYFASLTGADFSFVPQSMPGATNPPFLGEKCWGVDLRTKPLNEIWLNGCDVSYLADAYQMAKSAGKTAEFWGKSWGNSRFWSDLLSGSSKLREQITAGVPAERI